MHKNIFVSSTFQDMHLERDAIHTTIVPAINRQAKKYGESVSVCDLRWGINTSDLESIESSTKVLNVCLDEIDRCKPYMIVLLGDRYGWIPDEMLISRTIQSKEDFTLDDMDISVTALEIEYGALAHPENIDYTLFYFREIDGPRSKIYDSETEIHRKKLKVLKDKIQSIPHAHVRTYHVDLQSPEESMRRFSKMIYEDLHDLLQKEWEKNKLLDAYAIDQKIHWEFLNEKSAHFLARKELLEKCIDISVTEHQNFLIHGKAGSGKSTLISRVGLELHKNNADIVPIYCGYTNYATSGFDILQYIIYETERRLGIPHFTDQSSETPKESEWLSYFHELLEYYSKSSGPNLVFLIDGIDQLTQDSIAENYSYIPNESYANIQFVLSTVDNGRLPLKRHILVDDLTETERGEVISGILASKHRELSDMVIDKILQLKNTKLPLYLSLIIQRLIMMDRQDFKRIQSFGTGIDAINQYQCSLIEECPDSLNDLSVYVAGKASNQVGGEAVKLMGYFIALSRHGLRFSDLEMLVNAIRRSDGTRMTLNMADTAGYLQYCSNFFFIRSDGRIDFTHKCFRDGLRDSVESNALAFHQLIASWLHQLSQDDSVRNMELSWHLIQAKDITNLINLRREEGFNEVLCQSMAKDLSENALADNGEWLKKGLFQLAKDSCFMEFSSLVTDKICFMLPNSHKGLEIQRELVSVVIEIEKEILKNREHYGIHWDLSVQYERLSSIEHSFGLPEKNKISQDYARKCLKIRKDLFAYMQKVVKDKNQTELFLFMVEITGRHFNELPSFEKINAFFQQLLCENLRGICVADEHLAKALESDFPETAREALYYLEDSLSIRQQMFSSENFRDFCNSDAEYEMSEIHIKISLVYEELADEKSLKKAEDHLMEALTISKTNYRNNPTNKHTLEFGRVYRLLALFIADYHPNDIQQAISYAEDSRKIIEPLYRKTRSANIETELGLLYNALGNLYHCKGDVESQALSLNYYEKANNLTQSILIRNESEEIKKFAIMAELKEALSIPNLTLKEMNRYFSAAYTIAKELFEDANTLENYGYLEDVYMHLHEVIKKSSFGKEIIGQRSLIEVAAACYNYRLQTGNLTLDNLKEIVVEFSELSSALQELNLPDDAAWPKEWMKLLQSVGISEETLKIMPAYRSYLFAQKSLSLSRNIYQQDSSISGADFLAVSLDNYSQICMQIDLQEFEIINKELLDLASKLHKETRNEKYLLMILHAQMGACLAAGDISGALDVVLSPDSKQSTPTSDKMHKESTNSNSGTTEKKEPVTAKGLRAAFRSVLKKIKPEKK